jgi:hypothetical protein
MLRQTALALFLIQPLVAQAAVSQITTVNQGPADVTVDDPTVSIDFVNSPEVWEVTYSFTNLEYTIPNGGGAQQFALPDFTNVTCSSGAGAGGTDVVCRFDSQAAGFFQLTNSGRINGVHFTVPEPSTWAMMVVGFVGLSLAAVWRSRNAKLGPRAA